MYKHINITSQNTQEALSEALEFIHSSLESMSLSTKEANRAQLMAEEALVKLVEHGDLEDRRALQISIRKFFGRVNITLTVPGKEFDFANSLDFAVNLDDEEMTPYDADAIQNLLLHSFGDKLKYTHRNGCNRIRIVAVRSVFTTLYWTLGALFLAVAAGLMLKSYASPVVCELLNNNVFSPVSSVFMNALKMCAVPVVFLSIASCIAQFADLSEIKRIGTRLLIYFVLMQCVSVMVGICVFTLIQPGRSVIASPSISTVSGGASFSALDTVVNLMPSNIVRPFLEANMLQLIVLAVFIGTSVGGIGAKTIRSFLEESSQVFMRLTGVIMRFIPLVIFCSITSMLLTTGYAALLSLLGIVGTTFAGYAALMLIYYLLVASTCRLNPSRLFTKSLPMMITAFSTSSSLAAIPDSMKCAESMGISQKVYSLAIPLGFSINKNAMSMYIAAVSLFLARVYGVEVHSAGLVMLFVSTVMLMIGAPSMPGATLMILSILMSQLGVPVEAVSLIMGINPVLDMFETACCCFGTMASTLLTATHSGMLDVDEYNRA